MNKPGVVLVVSALLAGVGLGAVIVSASRTPSASAGSTRDLVVVSRWSGHLWEGAPSVRLVSGSLGSDPGRGFALVETKGLKPAFFSTPEGDGALRLSSVFKYGWQLRSSRGASVIVDPGAPELQLNPSFTYLGRRLNPEKLGPIASRGVAVAFGDGPWKKNGRRERNYVVLVSKAKAWPGWKVYGYLPGFTLPRIGAVQKAEQAHGAPVLGTQQELRQPLLGPDGRFYSIDAKSERLEPLAGWSSAVRTFKFGHCTTWAARSGGSYRACPNAIRLRTAHGAGVTVFRRHLGKLAAESRSWVFAQPSPNGKWLLLQDAFGACGIATWAYFLPDRGGHLWSAFPGAYTSEALGWLPDNTALVAAQSEGCEGNETAGVYQVLPGNSASEGAPALVFPGHVFDATTWGFWAEQTR